MTQDGSFKPLTDALVGGILSFLMIPIPYIVVTLDRPNTIPITSCLNSLCTVSQVADTAID